MVFKKGNQLGKKFRIGHQGYTYWKGKSHSKDTNDKISEANKGKHNSSETEFKKGNKCYWKGKNLLEETRKKISKKLLGRKKSENAHKFPKGHKINLGKSHSEGHNLKIGLKNIGNKNTLGKHWKLSEKTKAKMIIARSKIVTPFKDTSIEIKIQNFLKLVGIEHFTHFYISEIEHKYKCDILIPFQKMVNQKMIIECDGDFIHCNPLKYSPDFVRYPNHKKIITAKDIWERDEIRTKELLEKGFRVLRLWESEINNMNIEQFKERLKI